MLLDAALTLSDADECLARFSYDAIVLDYDPPGGNSIEFIHRLRRDGSTLPIIYLTAGGEINMAVEAMQAGADIHLEKPVRFAELEVFLQKSFEIGKMRSELRHAQREKKIAVPYWGTGERLTETRRLADLAAAGEAIVLLQGETGTGKGLVARWIHNHSSRRDRAFVVVNCAGLHDELLASELFGHAKGAFTSAVNEKPGLMEEADGGTLFLDEVSSMNKQVQSELMKVLEERAFRRVGETRMRTSNFRLICADNHDLAAQVRLGVFRSDLYYRLNVFPIYLPSLREQPQCLHGYVRHILEELDAPEVVLDDDALALLLAYDWPGNMRELRNVLERALLLAGNGRLQRRHFPGLTRERAQGLSAPTLAALEREHILRVLRECDGNTQRAAARLGISRQSLYRRLKKYREE